MIVNETEFITKDGRTALLRSPREDDAQALIDYLRVTAGETEFVIRYPEECGRYSIDGEKAFINNINTSDRDAMLICIVDGELAGTCQISWTASIKTRHRASVAIALTKAYWGLGIGTRMMEELFRIARGNENLIQLELDFVEGNSRARALYEKLGFRITGVKPNAIRLKDGTLLNEYSLVNMLDRH